jgi:hypothetical protein
MKKSIITKGFAAAGILMAGMALASCGNDKGNEGPDPNDKCYDAFNVPGCDLPADWCINYPTDLACPQIEPSSDSSPSSDSGPSTCDLNPDAYGCEHLKSSDSNSGKSSDSQGSEELCKIGNTTVSRIVGPNYDVTSDGIDPFNGEMLSDNCEVPGTDGLAYLTMSTGEMNIVKGDPTATIEEIVCGSAGALYVNNDVDPFEYWKVKADADLCAKWREEGRIQ